MKKNEKKDANTVTTICFAFDKLVTPTDFFKHFKHALSGILHLDLSSFSAALIYPSICKRKNSVSAQSQPPETGDRKEAPNVTVSGKVLLSMWIEIEQTLWRTSEHSPVSHLINRDSRLPRQQTKRSITEYWASVFNSLLRGKLWSVAVLKCSHLLPCFYLSSLQTTMIMHIFGLWYERHIEGVHMR